MSGKCAGVTGQIIPTAGLYPGLKQPRLDYTQAYYGLGQFIPREYNMAWANLYPGSILWPRPIHTPQAKLYPHDKNRDINSVERYTQELFNLSTRLAEDSVLSGRPKLSEKAKLTELKS